MDYVKRDVIATLIEAGRPDLANVVAYEATSRAPPRHVWLNRRTGKPVEDGRIHTQWLWANPEALGLPPMPESKTKLTDDDWRRAWKDWLQISSWGYRTMVATDKLQPRDIRWVQKFLEDEKLASEVEVIENNTLIGALDWWDFLKARSRRDFQ